MFGDYEWLFARTLADMLNADGVEVTPYAGELPSGDLADTSVQVLSTGGPRLNPGVATPLLAIDYRARGEAEVMALARAADALMLQLDDMQPCGDGALIVAVTPANVPYLNPDPSNRDFDRASQLVEVTVKAT